MAKLLKRLADAEFYYLIANAEPFEAIIKAAIVIEVEMEALFQIAFTDPDSLAEMRMTYDQKVMLTIAIGLEPRFTTPLRALARLRNRFAHTLDAEFKISDADNLYSAFDQIDRSVIKEALSKGGSGKLSDFEPRDKLSICVVTLRSALIAAQKELRRQLNP